MPGWWKTVLYFLSKDLGKEGRATASDWNLPSAQPPRYRAEFTDWVGLIRNRFFSPYLLDLILLPIPSPVQHQLNLGAGSFNECTQDLIWSNFFFLILKSLYFKSKITCNRLPVYFNVYFGEGRPDCCVECFTFCCTQQHRGINCVMAADAGHSSCGSSMVSCSEMHSNTIHFLELSPYSGDVLNMRELSPSPLVPSYVEVSLLNLE